MILQEWALDVGLETRACLGKAGVLVGRGVDGDSERWLAFCYDGRVRALRRRSQGNASQA